MNYLDLMNVILNLRKKFIKTYYAQFNKQGYTKLKNDFNNNIK